jgi:hypothetical protein
METDMTVATRTSIGLALTLLVTGGGQTAAFAEGLSLGLGGVSVGVNSSSGLSVGVGVGSAASVGASVGSGGIDADVGVGPGGSVASVGASVGATTGATVGATVGPGVSVGVGVGTSPTTGPVASPGTQPPGVVIPKTNEVRAALRRSCSGNGNSTVYNGYIVFAANGVPVGVARSASVGSDLRIHEVTFATLDSFAKPARCLTVSGGKISVGAAAIQLSYSGNDLHRTLASN